MKVCKKCDLEYEPFGHRHRLCRPCKREYDREYHANRSSDAKARKMKLQDERLNLLKGFILEYLLDNPCVVCSEPDPVVLEFDHIVREEKSRNISDMIRSGCSVETLRKEIAKCQVLCANCHKRRTAKQFGWFKNDYR